MGCLTRPSRWSIFPILIIWGFCLGKFTDLIGKSAPPLILKWISHLPMRSRTISRNDLHVAIADFHTPLPNHFGNSLKNESPCKSISFCIGRRTLPNICHTFSNLDRFCFFVASSHTWLVNLHSQYFWNGSATCLLGPGPSPEIISVGPLRISTHPFQTILGIYWNNESPRKIP